MLLNIKKNKKEIILLTTIIMLFIIIIAIISFSNYALVTTSSKEKIINDADNIYDIYEQNIIYDKDGITLFEMQSNKKRLISNKGAYGKIYKDNVIYLWVDGVEEKIEVYKISVGGIKEIREKLIGGTSNPSIYENKVIWADVRKYPDYDNNDIYLYDLSKNSEIKLYTEKSWKGGLDIYKDFIIYSSNKNEQLDIYIYDLSVNSEEVISSAYGDQWNPKVFKNIIIWIDERGNYPEIYYYNMDTGKEKKVPESEGAYNIDIYGDYIVWDTSSVSREGTNIYLYDISTGETKIIEDNDNGYSPKIYKNRIVWFDKDGGIYLYTFPTKESNIYLGIVILLTIVIIILVITLIWIRIKKRRLAKLEVKNEEEIIKTKDLESKPNIFQCPSCNKSFKLTEPKRPVTIKCPHCGEKGEIK